MPFTRIASSSRKIRNSKNDYAVISVKKNSWIEHHDDRDTPEPLDGNHLLQDMTRNILLNWTSYRNELGLEISKEDITAFIATLKIDSDDLQKFIRFIVGCKEEECISTEQQELFLKKFKEIYDGMHTGKTEIYTGIKIDQNDVKYKISLYLKLLKLQEILIKETGDKTKANEIFINHKQNLLYIPNYLLVSYSQKNLNYLPTVNKDCICCWEKVENDWFFRVTIMAPTIAPPPSPDKKETDQGSEIQLPGFFSYRINPQKNNLIFEVSNSLYMHILQGTPLIKDTPVKKGLSTKESNKEESAGLRDAKRDVQVPLSPSVSALACPPSADGFGRPASSASNDASSSNGSTAIRPGCSARQSSPSSGSSPSMARSKESNKLEKFNKLITKAHKEENTQLERIITKITSSRSLSKNEQTIVSVYSHHYLDGLKIELAANIKNNRQLFLLALCNKNPKVKIIAICELLKRQSQEEFKKDNFLMKEINLPFCRNSFKKELVEQLIELVKQHVKLINSLSNEEMRESKDKIKNKITDLEKEIAELQSTIEGLTKKEESAGLRDAKRDVQVPLSPSVSALACPPSADGFGRPASSASNDASSSNGSTAIRPGCSARQSSPSSGSSPSMARSLEEKSPDGLFRRGFNVIKKLFSPIFSFDKKIKSLPLPIKETPIGSMENVSSELSDKFEHTFFEILKDIISDKNHINTAVFNRAVIRDADNKLIDLKTAELTGAFSETGELSKTSTIQVEKTRLFEADISIREKIIFESVFHEALARAYALFTEHLQLKIRSGTNLTREETAELIELSAIKDQFTSDKIADLFQHLIGMKSKDFQNDQSYKPGWYFIFKLDDLIEKTRFRQKELIQQQMHESTRVTSFKKSTLFTNSSSATFFAPTFRGVEQTEQMQKQQSRLEDSDAGHSVTSRLTFN